MIKTKFNIEELKLFLLEARKNGYAGGAEKISTPQRPGFNEFAPFKKDDFEYVDSYSGYYYAPGQEVIRFKGVPVWNMAYNGGMLPTHHGDLEFTNQIFAFLHKALALSDLNNIYRGPKEFKEGDYLYTDENEGDITNFKGTEKIFYKGKEVFRQDYIGGLIVQKTNNP